VGSYPFTVTASANGLTRSASGTLTVQDGIAPAAAMKASFIVGGTVGPTTLGVRTSWGASDPSGIAAFGARRSANAGSGSMESLSAATATSITQGLTFGATYRYGARATDGAANTGNWADGATFKPVRTQQYNSAV